MIRLCYLPTYFLLVFFFHFGCHIVIMFFWWWFLQDTIDVPYFFHKQWQVYPRFVRLAYLGTPFYIRVRQLHNKVYFADGLQHLRKDLQIYESVTITFMAMENKYNFDIFFTPDLHHQSCGRPLLFSREYVWTIEISQWMLGELRPLVTITTSSKFLIHIVAYIWQYFFCPAETSKLCHATCKCLRSTHDHPQKSWTSITVESWGPWWNEQICFTTMVWFPQG